MIISRPVPFAEAVRALAAKELLPTTAGSAQLERLSAEITRRGMFSAKVPHTGTLQRALDLIARIVDPVQEPGAYMDVPTFRLEMKDYLASIGYAPEPGKQGSIQDLMSDGRLNLIADTNEKMLHGLGQHMQAQDPQVLDAFPAQELYRAGNFFSKNQRPWVAKWQAAGGRLYGGGRMIALKDDPIWTLRIEEGGFNRFGNPYPPFDYNSGMWVKPVSRQEAVEFGLIAQAAQVKPSGIRLDPDGLQAQLGAISGTLRDILLQSMPPGARVDDAGVLHMES